MEELAKDKLAMWWATMLIGILFSTLFFCAELLLLPLTLLKSPRHSSRETTGGENRKVVCIDADNFSPMHAGPISNASVQYRSSEGLCVDTDTLFDVFRLGLGVSRKSASPLYLGTLDSTSGLYNWLSFDETLVRLTDFGSGLVNELDLGPSKEHLVGIYMQNMPEWVISSEALISYSMIAVPLFDTIDEDSLVYILNLTQMATLIISEMKIERIAKILADGKCQSLRNIIIAQSKSVDHCKAGLGGQDLLSKLSIQVYAFDQIEQIGRRSPVPYRPPVSADTAFICFTSGTTGNPKGVVITHKNIVADIDAIIRTLPKGYITARDIHFSYLPLGHVFERAIAAAMTFFGASLAFYSGSVPQLLDDASAACPTIFPSVPRLLIRLHDKIYESLSKTSFLKRALFMWAVSRGKKRIATGTQSRALEQFVIDSIFHPFRKRLGGRVKCIVTAAAPISADILQFLRIVFGCSVFEGYGQTECAGACTVSSFLPGMANHGGHVGYPVVCCRLKLVDVPELNYYHPKGEICIKGPNVMKGYYKIENSAVDADGWLHTGDVGEILPGGELQIIDRIKHIFKLNQGEFVSPEEVESVYSQSKFISQMFVYGNSLKSSLVAIVVPDFSEVAAWAKSRQLPSDLTTLCAHTEVRQLFETHFEQAGKYLAGYKRIRAFYLTPESFTQENGMLTPTMKLRRNTLKHFYQTKLDELYASIQEQALAGTTGHKRGFSFSQKKKETTTNGTAEQSSSSQKK